MGVNRLFGESNKSSLVARSEVIRFGDIILGRLSSRGLEVREEEGDGDVIGCGESTGRSREDSGDWSCVTGGLDVGLDGLGGLLGGLLLGGLSFDDRRISSLRRFLATTNGGSGVSIFGDCVLFKVGVFFSERSK